MHQQQSSQKRSSSQMQPQAEGYSNTMNSGTFINSNQQHNPHSNLNSNGDNGNLNAIPQHYPGMPMYASHPSAPSIQMPQSPSYSGYNQGHSHYQSQPQFPHYSAHSQYPAYQSQAYPPYPSPSPNFFPPYSRPPIPLQHTIKSLQDQLQLTIYNYQNILQTQKKNSSQRSQFLLYLLQSLRIRHLEQLESLSSQLTSISQQKQSLSSMQKQMENIGEGLDQIVQQSGKLKLQNQMLVRQLQECELKERELQSELGTLGREISNAKERVDQWERVKIKWNRGRKELLEMIEDVEKIVGADSSGSEGDPDRIDLNKWAINEFGNQKQQQKQKLKQKSSIQTCQQSGQPKSTCQHCQATKIQQMRLKYSKNIGSSNQSPQAVNSNNNGTNFSLNLGGFDGKGQYRKST